MGWFTRDPDAKFWVWFSGQQERLLAWPSDPTGTVELVARHIRKVDERLTFELGPIVDGTGEFIISADGNRELFPLVERLANAAPSLPRWRITRLRPRRPLHAMRVGDRTVGPDDLRFIAYPDGSHVGLVVLVAGWTQDSEDLFHHAAWIFLDQALGEHAVVMRVGLVEVMAPTEELLAQSRPMSELATVVDAWPSSARATGRPGARYPVEPAEEVWTVLQGTNDGTPLTARRNDAAEQLMMHADYRHRVTVTVPFRETNHAGFPEGEELNTIGTIEDTVRDALEAGQAALLTLAVAGGGKRSLVFYSRAPELAETAVHGVRGRFPSHGIFVHIDEDGAWSEYRAYLAAGDAK